MTTIDLSPVSARTALRGIRDDETDAGASDALARAWWSHLIEPGDADAGRLVGAVGAVQAFEAVRARATDVLSRHGIDTPGTALNRWCPRLDAASVTASLRTAAVRGVRLLVPGDRAWPHRVDDLGPHAPLCLWVRGEAARLGATGPAVAIVGARAATSYGDHVAVELAADLAASGVVIVSGGAYGIDGAAHRAALAAGGTTIALMAGGADRSYPVGHAALLDRITAHGAVVSEVPCGSAPTKWRFLARNRVIAAMSDATVVVEAGWRSGSLNTAGHAAALGRPLGAVPGAITSATSAGSHRLMREFGATCITSADDVRELLGIDAGTVRRADDRRDTDDSTRVRDALSTRSWREAADVARRSGLDRAAVEPLLGLMLLQGEVERGTSGWRLAVRD